MAGLDVNRGMLAVARSLQPAGAAGIEWHEGSALELPFDDRESGCVLCQLGLQFFPDRTTASWRCGVSRRPAGGWPRASSRPSRGTPRRMPSRMRSTGTSGKARRWRSETSTRSRIPRSCVRCSPPQASRTSAWRRLRGPFGSRPGRIRPSPVRRDARRRAALRPRAVGARASRRPRERRREREPRSVRDRRRSGVSPGGARRAGVGVAGLVCADRFPRVRPCLPPPSA